MPSLMRLPIRLRMALWFAALLWLLVGAMSVFLLSALDDVVQEQIDAALRLRASRVEREITTGDDDRLDPQDVQASLLDLAPFEELSAPGIYVQVRDIRGAVIAASANLPRDELPVTQELLASALQDREAFETVSVGNEQVRILAWPVDTSGPVVGVVVVGQSLRLVEVTRQGVERLVTIAAIVATVAAGLGGWWLTSRALGPMADVTRVARDIAATGRFEQRIARPAGDDEVGQLVQTFNEMLARLERIFALQREFLADASHELRGPLMVIRGNLDLLRLGIPEDERRDCVREAGEEVERLSRLASDLLFLAATDAAEVVEQLPVRLDQVVVGAWERARLTDHGRHEIVLGENQPSEVIGDRTRLDQLAWNLVENALRYTQAGGRVELSLTRAGNQATFVVRDTGLGIAAEHLPRIFERFYRVDKARSRGNGGTGLGLAIVKRVAESHQGHVSVTSEPGRGTTFTVTLYVRAVAAQHDGPSEIRQASAERQVRA
ncbi:MAG: HAMP domain-containing protein [Chloroflexi bacterium]|nr:HAMP domain-containing protein [Chloroflexota bacterium]